jgi:hypothetical protein
MSQRTKIGYLGLAATLGLAVLAASLTWAAKPAPKPLANPALVFCGGTRWGSGGLFISTADGSRRQQITSHGGKADDCYPVWSPDGKRIAFLRYPDTSKIYCDLYLINADGTNLRLIRSFRTLGHYLPLGGMNWSPDGRMLIYTCDWCYATAVLNVETGACAEFPKFLPYGDTPQGTPDFGPDMDPLPGFQGPIAYETAWHESVWDEVQQKWIYIVHEGIGVALVEITEHPITGEIQTSIGPSEPGANFLELAGGTSNVSWSPDGGSIGFVENACLKVVHVQIDVDGIVFGEPVVLCNWRDYYDMGGIGLPTWSPDGVYMAFSAYSGQVTGGGQYQDVFRMRADGSGLTAVSTVGDKEAACGPDWNPAWVNDLP